MGIDWSCKSELDCQFWLHPVWSLKANVLQTSHSLLQLENLKANEESSHNSNKELRESQCGRG